MERGDSQQAQTLPGRKNNRHRAAGESEKGGMKKQLVLIHLMIIM